VKKGRPRGSEGARASRVFSASSWLSPEHPSLSSLPSPARRPSLPPRLHAWPRSPANAPSWTAGMHGNAATRTRTAAPKTPRAGLHFVHFLHPAPAGTRDCRAQDSPGRPSLRSLSSLGRVRDFQGQAFTSFTSFTWTPGPRTEPGTFQTTLHPLHFLHPGAPE
jgi:hypothetical protein